MLYPGDLKLDIPVLRKAIARFQREAQNFAILVEIFFTRGIKDIGVGPPAVQVADEASSKGNSRLLIKICFWVKIAFLPYLLYVG